MSAARSSTMPAPPGSSRPADEQRTGTDMDDEGREMQKAKNSVLKIQRAKKEEGEHGRPPKIDVQTLYVLYMVLFMMIWMSLFRFRYPQHAEFLRYTPAVEALAACFFFTFVTVMLQALLANALSEKPAPSPLPPPVNQWIMGISVWMFGVLYYLVYASMSDGYAVEPGYSGLLIAGVASVVSLALTVYNMLQRPVFA